MFCHLKVHNFVKEPVTVNFLGIFKLLTFVRQLLILVRHIPTKKKTLENFTLVIFLDFLLVRFLCLYTTQFFC